MNRMKGSVIAKIIAWLILVVSAVVCVGSGIAMIVMEDYGVFRQTKEETLEDELADVSYNYAVRALDNYRNGFYESNEKYFDEDRAFCYGIIAAEGLDGIDLNNDNSYLMRNFSKRVNQEELQISLFDLSQDSEVWYYDDIFGESGYFRDDNFEKTLYADRICYDVAEGIFYYRAGEKYYPVQNVDLIIIRELEDGTYEMQDFDFAFDNTTGKYKNLYALNERNEEDVYENSDMTISAIIEMPEMAEMWIGENEKIICAEQPFLEMGSEELSVLLSETDITFRQFDGTLLEYTKLGSIIFDGIRQLNASELSIIDSQTIPQNYFVEVESAYLDEYYTLHVWEKNAIQHYTVVSYIDHAVVEAEKEKFLNALGNHSSLLETLEAIVTSKDVNAYARVSVLVDVLYEMKKDIVGMLFGTLVLSMACIVFLLCAAGHRRKTEEIVPTFIDKIPFDILCVLTVILEGIAFLILIEAGQFDSIIIVIQLFVGIGVIMACLAMMTLLSFVVRVKMGKWWRNTVTYWIFNAIRRISMSIWKNMGIFWKVLMVGMFFALFMIPMGFVMIGEDVTVVVFVTMEIFIMCAFLMIGAFQFRKLQEGSRLIAEGNLQQKIDTTKMYWEFKKHADNLNRISEGMSHAVDERMKSERFKTELITNVSHDIKTPLTSIINYVDLLEKTDIQDENAREYLEVLNRQSARLKKLIEDLIEASKASTGNLSVSMEELEANVFVMQILGEFEEKVAKAGLELIIHKSEEEISVQADGRHLWRVVDNLMNNICKYAQPGSRVYINLEQTSEQISLTFKNMSKYPLNISSEELMERFVRGDSSRNTEGNGLGLSIAKSLMELMNGKLTLYVDGDLFKVVLEFPR